MVRVFTIKKWGAFIVAGFLPSVLFLIALVSFGMFYGLLFFLTGLFLAVLVGSLVIKHPFLAVLEGKGLLACTIDSTGVIHFFSVSVKAPLIKGFFQDSKVDSVFNRDTIFDAKYPVDASASLDDEDNIVLRLPKKSFSKSMFAIDSMPVLLYNSVLGQFYTKQMLSNLETTTFVQHLTLYLSRKVDELSSSVRDFARYVVEQTRPKTSLLENKLFWVVMIVIVIIMVLLFAPAILDTFTSTAPPSIPSLPVVPS